MEEIGIVIVDGTPTNCFLCRLQIEEKLAGEFLGEVFHLECLVDPDPALMDDLYELEYRIGEEGK